MFYDLPADPTKKKVKKKASRKKAAKKKPARKKKASKKAPKKKASRKKATRKKVTRKKSSRKKRTKKRRLRTFAPRSQRRFKALAKRVAEGAWPTDKEILAGVRGSEAHDATHGPVYDRGTPPKGASASDYYEFLRDWHFSPDLWARWSREGGISKAEWDRVWKSSGVKWPGSKKNPPRAGTFKQWQVLQRKIEAIVRSAKPSKRGWYYVFDVWFHRKWNVLPKNPRRSYPFSTPVPVSRRELDRLEKAILALPEVSTANPKPS